MKTIPRFVQCGSIHVDPERVVFVGPEQNSTLGKCTIGVQAGQGVIMVPCDVSAAKVVEMVELWHVDRDKADKEWRDENRELQRKIIEHEAKATADAIAASKATAQAA